MNEHILTISGKTRDEWAEFARRDDCLSQMVPSDLRMIIATLRDAEKKRDQTISIYTEWCTDIQRLARALDFAMHGEDAAEQPSLWDLIEPARDLRQKLDHALTEVDELKAKLNKAIESMEACVHHEPKGLYPDHHPNYWLLKTTLEELKPDNSIQIVHEQECITDGSSWGDNILRAPSDLIMELKTKIDTLEVQARKNALELISAYGQATDAYDAQVKAETERDELQAKLDKTVKALRMSLLMDFKPAVAVLEELESTLPK